MDVYPGPKSISRRLLLVSAASVFGAAQGVFAQTVQGWPKVDSTTPPQPGQPAEHPRHPAEPASGTSTFSTGVRVVSLYATVRNKSGEIVHDLTKDDFLLSDEGKPQVIRYFSQQTDLPLTLGLLIDTSMSQRRVLGEERTASYHFFERVLRPDRDQAFVIHFDHEVELLRDLTSSRKELEAALNLLQTPEEESGYGSGPGGGGSGWPGGGGSRWPTGGGRRGSRGPGTTLYDAVLLSSDDLMKKQTGRKAVVILSDGVDTGSRTSLQDAISSAQHSDTLAYSIRFFDDGAYGGGFGGMSRRGGMGRIPTMGRTDGKAVLERISKQTGASYFEVSKKLSTEGIYTRIEDELRNQYSLGFTPDPPATNGEFRRVELTAKRQDLIVQTREGYYARES